MIAIMCSKTLRRKHPWNLLALVVFTLVMSVLVGTICAYWQTSVVLEAFAVTGAAVAGLTLVAVFGKFDITKKVRQRGRRGVLRGLRALLTPVLRPLRRATSWPWRAASPSWSCSSPC